MQPAIVLALLSAVVCGAFGQSCPGAKAPEVSAAVTGVINRAKLLGYVPTDEQVSSAPNVQRIMRLLPQDKFEYLFPLANEGVGPSAAPYNYANFLKAAAIFPDLCNNAYGGADLDTTCLAELASMFAMFGQETGAHNPSSKYPQWRQALYYYNEVGCSAGGGGCLYCSTNAKYPCAEGKYYFGRGPFQLSYNYNYGLFSSIIYGDASVLLNNPDLVISGPTSWLAFASAFWFYMTPQEPKPSMHDVATGYWIPNAADVAAGRNQGFGAQIMIINGGIECGGPAEIAQAANRISYYTSLAEYLGISPGANLGCANMKQFDTSSSASYPRFWEKNWNKICECQLVSYETPNSIFDAVGAPAAYQKCLDLNFPDSTIDCRTLKACYSGCKNCTNVPACTGQTFTENICGPCAQGQTWWPCNTSPQLCYCVA